MIRRRIRLGSIGFAAATAVLTICAPQATADIGVAPYSLSVSGSQHTVGCTYQLTATHVPSSWRVAFADNGQPLDSSIGSVVLDTLFTLPTVSWTPKTAGTHTLTGTSGDISELSQATLTVEVSASGGGNSCGGGMSSVLPSFSG
ncbi:hypothetical protein [Nocardia sp. NBC_01327]|uniref:hypothetical protein n=1 Tax=Nocardia sp. NBC_01327 TaxID=2903593 RepID=UPI002E0FF8D6|nr:hypothetical protein OG326_09460 [Nocardia sp. NBC_01327]